MTPFLQAGIQDVLLVGTLVVLEGLLSADNALILAVLVRHLAPAEQKKALLYGMIGAFALRAVAISLARTLMSLWWLCALGSAYLLFLCGKHFLSGGDAAKVNTKPRGFWSTVAQVEFTDLVFAIDSILVAVALVHNPHKIWVVYAGGFIGIVLLRSAAGFFLRLLTRYPALDRTAYALVGWAGVKLASESADIWAAGAHHAAPHLLPGWAFWAGFALICGVGGWWAGLKRR